MRGRFHTYEYIYNKVIELEKNYKLLSTKYNNAHDKLLFECDKGHKFFMSWSNYKSGNRCKQCYILSLFKSIKDIKLETNKRGDTLISTEYTHSEAKLEFKCKKNHTFYMNWHDYKKGRGCSICNDTKFKKGKEHIFWKDGKSLEIYGDSWSPQLKERIKRRDNYKCQNPNCRKNSDILCPHHIDYNKHNCSESNLITLCKSCNSRANFYRNKWYEFYITLMENKICMTN